MKTYPKLLIFLLLLLAACTEDDNKAKLSDHELLVASDWITYTVEREPDFDVEPDLIFAIWSFTETSFAIGDYTGTFYEQGNWSLEDDVLTIDGEEIVILHLTKEKLVYEDRQGTIITRLPVAKIDR